MRLYLPDSKAERVIFLCNQLLHNPTCSIRHLCMVIGVLVSTFPAVPLSQLFYRNLERCKIYHLRRNGWNYNKNCTIDFKCVQELKWWCSNALHSSAPINRGPPQVMVTTDASDWGWGSDLAGQRAHGHFSLQEQAYSINTRETLAIFFAIRSFASALQNKHVLIKSDNTMAIAYVKKMGGMDSLLWDSIARDIWLFAQKHNIWLSITFIPGRYNLAADENSRIFSENTEWELNDTLFQKILTFWSQQFTPTCDLFASRLNFKLPVYMSFGPDPFATHVDCFTVKWDQDTVYYMYPPFQFFPGLCRSWKQNRQQRS